ncbi:hypothetical protein F4781DRAFT_30196 [Annulohypoxylon bovei var. microspora]|nr:hypothetical protein F4781DRAFT_30196 [Annulohypoxylon bovei var. microspora]
MAATKTSGIPPGAIPATASFLGPLTTTFTAPTTCGTGNTYSLGADSTAVIWQVGPTNSDDSCMPSKWVVNGFYSPAICPYGYTNACFRTQSNIETTICCPTNVDFSCYSGIAYNKFGCSYSAPTIDLTSLLINYAHMTTIYQDVEISAQPIWAFSVQVQKAVSITAALISTSPDISALDVPIATSNSTSGTNLNTIPDVSSNTTPAAQSGLASTGSPPPASSISSGAIAGIVVGVLGALALGIVGTFLLMRRRKTRDMPPSNPDPNYSALGHQQFIQGPESVVYELGVKEKAVHELDEQRRASEMPSWAEHNPQGHNKQMVWELPA